MREISHILRKAVIDALNPIIIEIDSGFYYTLNMNFGGDYGEITIPVFDERVNPNVPIPSIAMGTAYILIRDQQENEATNDKCQTRQNALISIDCVTKFPLNVGSKYFSELISDFVQQRILSNLDVPGWQVMKVSKANSQSIVEQGVTTTAYRKFITYNFDVYER